MGNNSKSTDTCVAVASTKEHNKNLEKFFGYIGKQLTKGKSIDPILLLGMAHSLGLCEFQTPQDIEEQVEIVKNQRALPASSTSSNQDASLPNTDSQPPALFPNSTLLAAMTTAAITASQLGWRPFLAGAARTVVKNALIWPTGRLGATLQLGRDTMFAALGVGAENIIQEALPLVKNWLPSAVVTATTDPEALLNPDALLNSMAQYAPNLEGIQDTLSQYAESLGPMQYAIAPLMVYCYQNRHTIAGYCKTAAETCFEKMHRQKETTSSIPSPAQ